MVAVSCLPHKTNPRLCRRYHRQNRMGTARNEPRYHDILDSLHSSPRTRNLKILKLHSRSRTGQSHVRSCNICREVSVLRTPIFHKKVYFSMMSKPGFISLHGYTFFAVFCKSFSSSWLYSLFIKTNLVLSICIFFVLDHLQIGNVKPFLNFHLSNCNRPWYLREDILCTRHSTCR